MNRSVYNSNTSRFYIRLRVTSNGQTATAFRTVYVNNTRYQDATASKDTASWQEVVELSEGNGVFLEAAYPNALSEETQIGFYLPEANVISLDILNLNGQHVRNVVGGPLEAGSYDFTLKREDLSPGLYFYRLTVDGKQYARRLVVE